MKSSTIFKVRPTGSSPKNRKNAGRERDKDRLERRRAEHHVGQSPGPMKVDPSQLLVYLMKSTTKQYAGLSEDSIASYSEQSIFERAPHEVSYSLAEDLSYKLRHLIHAAQVKAKLSGRLSLLGSDVEATMEDLVAGHAYGACNSANFIQISVADKHFYLDDALVNLVEAAEESPTVIQPANAILARECYPEATPAAKNYARYFDTMCRALICSTVKLQHEALRDVRRNARVGPIASWFYHFGYFLLSKHITYGSLTLGALDLIAALEGNPIARQMVGERELKLLLRLILQRLLRTHNSFEMMTPMCAILALLCERAPLRELVVSKVAQRQHELQPEYALPLACIIRALGADALQASVGHLLQLHELLERERAPARHQLASVLLQCYRLLCAREDTALEHHCAFYDVFGYRLVPFWRHRCAHSRTVDVHVAPESNWLNVKAQLLGGRRRVLVPAGQPQARVQRTLLFEACARRKSYIHLKAERSPAQADDLAQAGGAPKEAFIMIGKWSTLRKRRKAAKSCLDHALMVI